MKFPILFRLGTFLLPAIVNAQLSGSVGPSTSTAHKRRIKQCNILNYGGEARATADNGPAIASAWAACKSGGEGRTGTPSSQNATDFLKSTSPPEIMAWPPGLILLREPLFQSDWMALSIEPGTRFTE
jgi:hypothetical protein